MKKAEIIALLEQGATITKQEHFKFSRGKLVRGGDYIRYRINDNVISSRSFFNLYDNDVIIKDPNQEYKDMLTNGQTYILNPNYTKTN